MILRDNVKKYFYKNATADPPTCSQNQYSRVESLQRFQIKPKSDSYEY